MSNTYKFFNDTKTAADRARAEQAVTDAQQAVVDAGQAAEEAINEGLERLVSPSRRVYVFGGADGTFPYFATFADARTYVNALTPAPSTSEPVSIFLLSASDGTPIEITGPDDWYALALDGIYVSSPYDPWAQYVKYGGVMLEEALLWPIQESELATNITG